MPPPKSIWLDAYIAVSIAIFTAVNLGLAQKESYEYVNPFVRFWLVLGLGALVQGLHALSKFRDNTFSRHAAAVKEHDVETEKTEIAKAAVPVDTAKP